MSTPIHQIHASPALGKGGRSFDLAGFRWRPDGDHKAAEPGLARAVAYRLAFTWNMAEGIPVEALEAGVVARFYRAAVELAEAVKRGDSNVAALAQEVLDANDAHRFDLGDGCQHCTTASAAAEAAPEHA